MGIGLTAQNFKSNRLPGWDKQSYGYHGDDGNSFSSSGNGKSYGPTFTTDDIIGCGVNLVTNSCFYTKNGHNLGVAFQELPVCWRTSSCPILVPPHKSNTNFIWMMYYWSASIHAVKIVSNGWLTNSRRNRGCQFRPGAVRLWHRRYAQRVTRIDESFHPKISFARRPRRLAKYSQQVSQHHLYLLHKCQRITCICIFLLQTQNGFSILGPPRVQFNCRIVRKSNWTELERRNVIDTNASKWVKNVCILVSVDFDHQNFLHLYSAAEILKLVLGGRMGVAIDHTLRSYPGLLENNQNLLFMLKCRQFVEMVNGSDFEVSYGEPHRRQLTLLTLHIFM